MLVGAVPEIAAFEPVSVALVAVVEGVVVIVPVGCKPRLPWVLMDSSPKSSVRPHAHHQGKL